MLNSSNVRYTSFSVIGYPLSILLVLSSLAGCDRSEQRPELLPVDDVFVSASSTRIKGGNGKGQSLGRPEYAGPDPNKIPEVATPPGLSDILQPLIAYSPFSSNLLGDEDGIAVDNDAAIITVSGNNDSTLYRSIVVEVDDNRTDSFGARVRMLDSTRNNAPPGGGTNQIVLSATFFNVIVDGGVQAREGDVVMQLYLRQQTDSSSRVVLCGDLYDAAGNRSALIPELNDDGRDGCVGSDYIGVNMDFTIGQEHDIEIGVDRDNGTIYYKLDDITTSFAYESGMFAAAEPRVQLIVHTFGDDSLTVAEINELRTSDFVDRDLSELADSI